MLLLFAMDSASKLECQIYKTVPLLFKALMI